MGVVSPGFIPGLCQPLGAEGAQHLGSGQTLQLRLWRQPWRASCAWFAGTLGERAPRGSPSVTGCEVTGESKHIHG